MAHVCSTLSVIAVASTSIGGYLLAGRHKTRCNTYDTCHPTFLSTIELQPDSLLLSIPPEIRLLIYEAVFDGSANNVGLLATCRLINEEAHGFAYRRIHLQRGMNRSAVFISKLVPIRRNLYDSCDIPSRIQHHLKHVTITMRLDDINPTGVCIPFCLTSLLLSTLKNRLEYDQVRKSGPFNPVGGFFGRIHYNHVVVAALLYPFPENRPAFVPPSRSEGLRKNPPSLEHCENYVGFWNISPLPEHFETALLRCQPKEVSVEYPLYKYEYSPTRRGVDDLVWDALRFFDLVCWHHPFGTIEKGKEKTEWMIYGDQLGLSTFTIIKNE
ncbi:hypothetical protein M011DRAFT_508753 [Sporormia fimetaria CBS 119925]|uniref:F-box domain-containing protein n=1 Tax=Sporormia fimetaria CBS 119925 TaxID=1340428 RepID=A0A6A6V1D5_9PLEO|nr:hypothetical protein M011DRAFT_508753 [Sporormia fimetaria CBS 119925]